MNSLFMIPSSPYCEPLPSVSLEPGDPATPSVLLILFEWQPRAEVRGVTLEQPVALVDVGQGLLQVVHTQCDLLLFLQT